jgi:hypothetical protein
MVWLQVSELKDVLAASNGLERQGMQLVHCGRILRNHTTLCNALGGETEMRPSSRKWQEVVVRANRCQEDSPARLARMQHGYHSWMQHCEWHFLFRDREHVTVFFWI